MLEQTLRRKQKQLEAKFKEMGMEAMDEALSRAASLPANPPYRLSTLIAETVERQVGFAPCLFGERSP